MVISSLSLLPHGAMILDLTLSQLPNGCESLHKSCKEASNNIKSTNSELVILLSPHGIALQHSIGVYCNESLQGSAEWLNEWTNYNITCNSNINISKDINNYFNIHNISSELIVCHVESCIGKLAWGEVVPLWFIREFVDNIPVIVISYPRDRINCREFTNISNAIGIHLYNYIQSIDSRVSLIISADLSHCHDCSISTRNIFTSTIISNDKLAKTFDNYVYEWSKAVIEELEFDKANQLIQIMLNISNESLTCGWAGICTIHSLLQHHYSQSNNESRWNGRVIDYQAPTYYGMIVISVLFNC